MDANRKNTTFFRKCFLDNYSKTSKFQIMMTDKRTDERINEIYNVNLEFKEYLLNWVQAKYLLPGKK